MLILASAPFHRATWTTFGVLGVFGATLNYDSDWFGSWKSPALMVAVSVGLILLGMALSLYSRVWTPGPTARPPRRNRSRPQRSRRTTSRPRRRRTKTPLRRTTRRSRSGVPRRMPI